MQVKPATMNTCQRMNFPENTAGGEINWMQRTFWSPGPVLAD